MNLSAVVLTKNEEKNIDICLRSLTFCMEIIVVDDNSTDNTENSAKKYNVIFLKRPLNNNFAAQRNFGLEKATGDWVLFIDADEVITAELALEIQNTLNAPGKKNGFALKRRDFWWGKELKHGETLAARSQGFVRLVKKGCGIWSREVHEVMQVSGEVGHLKYFINHYPHPTIKCFLEKINTYTSMRAQELLKSGKTTNTFQIITYPLGKFILTYFIKLGFLDGPAGFTYAFFMSFHSFLVRAKLYQYATFNEKNSN